MAISPISTTSAGLSNTLMTPVQSGGGDAAGVYRKHFGEPLPKLADIRNNPLLMNIFGQMGVLERIRRKLALYSRKKARLIAAQKTVACALAACEETANEDLVFVGVEFAAQYHQDEDTLAGVLAHEWGHLVSDFHDQGFNPDALSWEEIFALRKEEECHADAYAGRMLYLMKYNPEGLIRFLSQDKHNKETHKYHAAVTRGEIIKSSYNNTRRQHEQAQKIMSVTNLTYRNPMQAHFIAVA